MLFLVHVQPIKVGVANADGGWNKFSVMLFDNSSQKKSFPKNTF